MFPDKIGDSHVRFLKIAWNNDGQPETGYFLVKGYPRHYLLLCWILFSILFFNPDSGLN